MNTGNRKKKLTKNISTKTFDIMYSEMMKSNLFYGGKIIGAGGGGFFLMVSKKPNSSIKFLKKKKYKFTKIKFDNFGCKIISS